MPNSIPADVRRIIRTNLSDSDITELIKLADSEITDRDLDGLSTDTKKKISMLLTAELVSGRDPISRSVAEMKEDITGPEGWRKMAEETISRVTNTQTIERV